jgi:hypothetical protein
LDGVIYVQAVFRRTAVLTSIFEVHYLISIVIFIRLSTVS